MKKTIKNIPYTNSRDYRNCYDLYLPNTNKPCPLFIYFYGGSLKKGSKNKQVFPKVAVKSNIALALPDYRLITDVSYPCFIEDAAQAVAHIISNIKAYKNITDIYIGGHSAGAYLSMMLCFDKRYLLKYGIDSDSISGFMFISGQPTKHMSVIEAEGLDKRRVIIDDTAPLWYVRSHGAPIMIATSDSDMPNRREQNKLLYSTLKHFSYDSLVKYVEIDGCPHGAFTKIDANGNIPVLPYVLEFIKQTEKTEIPNI